MKWLVKWWFPPPKSLKISSDWQSCVWTSCGRMKSSTLRWVIILSNCVLGSPQTTWGRRGLGEDRWWWWHSGHLNWIGTSVNVATLYKYSMFQNTGYTNTCPGCYLLLYGEMWDINQYFLGGYENVAKDSLPCRSLRNNAVMLLLQASFLSPFSVTFFQVTSSKHRQGIYSFSQQQISTW